MKNDEMQKEIMLRKAELEKKGSVLKKLDSLYDEHARLLFLFDVSGSMVERVAAAKNGSFVDQYWWKNLDQIRADVAAALSRLNGAILDPLGMAQEAPGDEVFIPLADGQRGPHGEFMFTPSDKELKERIVRASLLDVLGVEPDPAKKQQTPPTKIELVRKLAKQEIANRFAKHPNSLVSVVPFSGRAEVLFDGEAPDKLWPALDSLNYPWDYTAPDGRRMYSDGGTDILNAIRQAVELCRQKPSPVGIHHVIIVTDGQDADANHALPTWVASLKASGVVLDYIHIGEAGFVNAGLKKACAELGGEYVVVNTEKDFADKFIEMTQRLLAPPASV
jgi:hypothetical protein